MSDLDALFANVLRDQTDDTARLVLADCLDEHGRADQAEFIRWSIRVGVKCVCDREGRWRYSQRQAGSLPAACRRTLNTFRSEPFPRPFTVARGFISTIIVAPQCFLQNAGGVFSAQPITGVRLAHAEPAWTEQGPQVPPWYWVGLDPDDYNGEMGEIPWAIAACGRQEARNPELYRIYEFASERAAHRWLCEACVAYGRQEAARRVGGSAMKLATMETAVP